MNVRNEVRLLDDKDIRIFWDLQRTRNITETAANLFMTQSAVTRRIQRLERELGTSLLVRKQGKLGVGLTAQGERFALLVEQWIRLDDTARDLKQEKPRIHLVFGGIVSVTCYLLSDFFEEYLNRNENVDIDLYTYNSWDVYIQLEQGNIDVGVAHFNPVSPQGTTLRAHPEIAMEHLISEPYVILLSKNQQLKIENGLICAKELNPDHEVYAEFDAGLQSWHKKFWPEKNPRMYAMGSVSLIIPQLLSRPGSWSVVPVSVAKELAKRYPLEWYKLTQNIPNRNCCIGVNQNISLEKSDAVSAFMKDLYLYLRRNADNSPLYGS